MLKKSIAMLLAITFLCGAVPFFDQEAIANTDECEAARQRCSDAIEACLLAAAAALADPTPVGEAIALYLCFRAAQKCREASKICNSGG